MGLDNFQRAFQDEHFRNAVVLTLVFTVLSSLVGQNTLGGSLTIAAWVVPEIVAGFLLYAFFRDEGTLNAVLDWAHLPSQDWLYSAPIIAVSLANVWRGTAFSMLIYSAALAEVPREITEAAEVDGAGGWRRLWHITCR